MAEEDLDLRLVRYFTVVAAHCHYGRAAAELRVAQPSLSRQIRRLEQQVGARLLDRRELPGSERRVVVFVTASRGYRDAQMSITRHSGSRSGQLAVPGWATRRHEIHDSPSSEPRLAVPKTTTRRHKIHDSPS